MVEGTRLLIWRTGNRYRGFESLPLRHRVLISQYRALELPNNARQRRLSHVGGSGDDQFPEGDGQFAAKISVGEFGATVWE